MWVEDIEDGVGPISFGFVKLPTNLFSTSRRENRDLLPDGDDDGDDGDDDDDGDDGDVFSVIIIMIITWSWLGCPA